MTQTGDQKRPDALLLIIDALRQDVVVNEAMLQQVAPNLLALKALGSWCPVTVNAPNTQYVMPALLTGTYPLDAGGTNWGCHGRPVTLAEAFKAAGYETRLLSTCILYDRALEFDRGFDTSVVVTNRRRALMQDIEYGISALAKKCADSAVGTAAMAEFVQHYGRVLRNFDRLGSQNFRVPVKFRRLRRYAQSVSRGARRELAILTATPNSAARRILSIPEAYLYVTLGRNAGLRVWGARLLNRVLRPLLAAVTPSYIRVKLLDAYEPSAEELGDQVDAILKSADRPVFSMIHLMDAHSPWPLVDQFWRNPLQAVSRIRRAKQYVRDIPGVSDIHTGLYLAGLNAIDRLFDRHRPALEKAISDNRLVMAMTGDHGTTIESWDKEKPRDLTRRFRTTDISTALILCGGSATLQQHGCYDSRDISASLLDAVGIDLPSGMQGRSALSDPPREAIVSENAGRGFCDLQHDDINFAVTGYDHRLYATIQENQLLLDGLFNIKEDVHELDNILSNDPRSPIADRLLATWYSERLTLTESRGITPQVRLDSATSED